jgi:5-formyltetrahydrofolate cyclo-ligase
MPETNTKAAIRRQLRESLASMTDSQRHAKSLAACALLGASPEFAKARVIMLYLSTPTEVDTAPLAIRAWQSGKTVVVPKVTWDQRRMLPVEISSLNTDNMTMTGPGVREPIAGSPAPVAEIDLVVVPGLGFTATGHRIGRGMGFYDRFLAQNDFIGVSCGLAFEEQILADVPVLDHDIPLAMLVTDKGIRRFATNCIAQK